MIRRAGWTARAVTVVAMLAAAAGCASEHQSAAVAPYGTDGDVSVPGTVSAGQHDAARLAMVGDSITVGAQPELQQAFAGIGLANADINAEAGRRMVTSTSITSGLDGIHQVMNDGPAPDLWVIALGTNDVGNYDPTDYAGAIKQLLAALPANAKVLWVNCYLSRFKTRSQQFDTVLGQVLTARGNAKVVDWASIAREDGVLADGIHPSGFGKDEFSQRVAQAVKDWTS